MDPTFANRVLRSPLILIQQPSARANRSLALSLWPGRTFCAYATEACERTVVTTGYASADAMQARIFEARTHRGTHAMSFCSDVRALRGRSECGAPGHGASSGMTKRARSLAEGRERERDRLTEVYHPAVS